MTSCARLTTHSSMYDSVDACHELLEVWSDLEIQYPGARTVGDSSCFAQSELKVWFLLLTRTAHPTPIVCSFMRRTFLYPLELCSFAAASSLSTVLD